MSDYFRPTPWEVVCGLQHWDGDESKLDHIIQTKDLTIIHGPQTSDNKNRLELTPRLAMMNRRVFGYIAGIHEADHHWAPSSLYSLSRPYFPFPGDPIIMTRC